MAALVRQKESNGDTQMMGWLAIQNAAKAVPKWAWWALLVLAGLWALRADARRDGYREAEDKILDEIEEDTNEKRKDVEAAERRITADLNAGELRRLTTGDPNNRFGMHGTEAD